MYERGFGSRGAGRGCRWTQARQAIIDIFKKKGGHLSAEDVFFQVKRLYPGVGIATVYRTLEFLHGQSMLNRFRFGEGSARYELKSDDKMAHHHHLICASCGLVIDYTDFLEREKELFTDLEKALSKKHDFKIDSHQVHFYGLCSTCRA
ncbi:transcriptional repressor [bacterium]|nr:transcriptional repressor [bacterium]